MIAFGEIYVNLTSTLFFWFLSLPGYVSGGSHMYFLIQLVHWCGEFNSSHVLWIPPKHFKTLTSQGSRSSCDQFFLVKLVKVRDVASFKTFMRGLFWVMNDSWRQIHPKGMCVEGHNSLCSSWTFLDNGDDPIPIWKGGLFIREFQNIQMN